MKKGEESPEGCIELCLYWFKGNLDSMNMRALWYNRISKKEDE